MDTKSSPDRVGLTDAALDAIMERIRKGEVSAHVKAFLSDYICARIWKMATQIANHSGKDGAPLESYQGQLKEAMLLAQSFTLDIMDAEIAKEQLKKAYESKTQVPAQRR